MGLERVLYESFGRGQEDDAVDTCAGISIPMYEMCI